MYSDNDLLQADVLLQKRGFVCAARNGGYKQVSQKLLHWQQKTRTCALSILLYHTSHQSLYLMLTNDTKSCLYISCSGCHRFETSVAFDNVSLLLDIHEPLPNEKHPPFFKLHDDTNKFIVLCDKVCLTLQESDMPIWR